MRVNLENYLVKDTPIKKIQIHHSLKDTSIYQ
jgi:hypothetical protein